MSWFVCTAGCVGVGGVGCVGVGGVSPYANAASKALIALSLVLIVAAAAVVVVGVVC